MRSELINREIIVIARYRVIVLRFGGDVQPAPHRQAP
jgi:hypothetical protein